MILYMYKKLPKEEKNINTRGITIDKESGEIKKLCGSVEKMGEQIIEIF